MATVENGGGPKIAVIVPTFNRASLVSRALDSVLAQTECSLEIIVVDDGSTDDTAAVVAGFGDSRLRYLRQDRKGAAQARNLGVDAAAASLVTFLDSDDEVDADWIESLLEPFARPDVGVVCSGLRIIDEESPSQAEEVVLPRDDGVLLGHQRALFLGGAFAVRRSAFLAVGGYEDIAARQQKQLGRRLAAFCEAEDLVIATIQRPLATVYRHAGHRISTDRNAQYQGIAGMLEADRDFILSRSSRAYAGYQRDAAVCAERLGLNREARSHLRQAIRHDPLNPRYYARLALNIAGRARA